MKKSSLIMMLVALFALISTAWADVTVESTMKSGGFKGTGAYEGTSIKRLQADKQSDASSIKFTGAIMSFVAGATEQIHITRLDKSVEWNLNSKKKTYTEREIAPFNREELKDKEKKAEKSKVRIIRSEFKVKKTGESEQINGFPCQEYLVSWLLEMENIETKEKITNMMNSNLWTTPETASIKKLQAEEMAFTKAYVKKIGLTMKPEEMKQFGMEMFTKMSGASEKDMEKGFATLKKEMGKIKGFPIRTVVSWNVESDKQAAAAREASSDDSEKPTNLTGGITGLISGFLGKKAKDSAKPDENAPLFSSTIEIKSISTDSVPSDTFEIPAGYTKDN